MSRMCGAVLVIGWESKCRGVNGEEAGVVVRGGGRRTESESGQGMR